MTTKRITIKQGQSLGKSQVLTKEHLGYFSVPRPIDLMREFKKHLRNAKKKAP